jgi:hypothetical protein
MSCIIAVVHVHSPAGQALYFIINNTTYCVIPELK